MTDQELPAVLTSIAAGGTPRTLETWQQDHMTALILGNESETEAVMPVSLRSIRAGGAAGSLENQRGLQIGWISSNQFTGSMGLRRKTRGSVPEWPSLLPEVDALLVMRRDEWSSAGRWYGQAGFEDVLGVRCLYLDMENAPTGRTTATGLTTAHLPATRYHVQVIAPSDLATDPWQRQMHQVYHDVYGSHGGARVRSAHFWAPALAGHFYREHYQFQIIGLWSAPPASEPQDASPMLMGYAVVGWSGWHSKRPRMDILELATRQWDTAVAAELIQTTCHLAWSKQVRQVRAVISVHDPYRGHLARMGFEDRWGYLMLARFLQAQRHLDRLAAALPSEAGALAIELSAPGELPLTLHRPGPAGHSSVPPMRLRAHARTIIRMLLNRLDITAAVRDGELTEAGGTFSERDIARLSLAFPWSPWAFHMLDYI